MRLPTLPQLRTFLAVVDTGSLSAAARRVHLTQPAVSQQLQELERILDVRLLDRASGRAVPTRAGEALIEPARRTLASAEDAAEAVALHRDHETWRLRIGTGATACTFLLPPVLAKVKEAMPGLEVSVAIGNTMEVVPRVEAGELDVALATLPVPPSRALEMRFLLREPMLALLPASSEMIGTLTAAQLAAHPLILYEAGRRTRSAVDEWFGRVGLVPRPVMEIGSVETIKNMVASGLGASVLPALALQEPVPGAQTHALDPPAFRDLGLLMRGNKILDRGLRLFLSGLEKAVEQLSLDRSQP